MLRKVAIGKTPDEPRLIVVDASVVLKWQLDDEECIPQAKALKNDFYSRGVFRVIAPQLLAYEVVNGLVTAARRKRISRNQAMEAMGNLMALGIELRQIEPIGILEMALKYNLEAYDAAYLALAENERCELWTGDKAFYQGVKGVFPRSNWIGDYTGEDPKGGQRHRDDAFR